MNLSYIDTNILIYYLAGSLPVRNNKIQNIFIHSFYISRLSQIEFLGWKGFQNSTEFIKAKKFLSYASIIEIDDEISMEAIQVRISKQIGLADAVIAATAKIQNRTLVTRNIKDFENLSINIYNPFS